MSAYKKGSKFNPDALPQQITPDEAAQALSQLSMNQRHSASTSPPRPSVGSPSQAAFDNDLGSSTGIHHMGGGTYAKPLPIPPSPVAGTVNSPNLSGSSWGSRPTGSTYPPRRPLPQETRLLHTPAPPDPDSTELWDVFQAANASRTGTLTSEELGSALVNADFTPFDALTVKSLVKMFSSAPAGQPQTISYAEFQNLWRFLAAWRELFERFDVDSSGRLSLSEFTNALVAFGYRLSTPFIAILYGAYGGSRHDRRPSAGAHAGMSFDLFVQACVGLKRMTDVFKRYDDDRDGYVTLSFEEFLTEILTLRE